MLCKVQDHTTVLLKVARSRRRLDEAVIHMVLSQQKQAADLAMFPEKFLFQCFLLNCSNARQELSDDLHNGMGSSRYLVRRREIRLKFLERAQIHTI